ncbi:MAG: RcnB family protein [Pigmentiphaga sp.]|nr:RcnB family protein [Pigmentiphaga sp.]
MRRLSLVGLGLACSLCLSGTAALAAPPATFTAPMAMHADWREASGMPPTQLVRDDRGRKHADRGHRGKHWHPSKHRGPPPHARNHRHAEKHRGWAPPPRQHWRAPAHHRWSRGDYLPPNYRHPRYVVDWRSRHYHRPPRGYQWMNVDGQVLLVGIATGLILQSILDR